MLGEQVFYFLFCFVKRASLPVPEPTVMARAITVDLDLAGIKTGGDGILQPVVIGFVLVSMSGTVVRSPPL